MNRHTSRITRRIFSTLAVAALIATGAIVTGTPAQAAYLGQVDFTGSSIVVEADLLDTFDFYNLANASTFPSVQLVNVTAGALSQGSGACNGSGIRCRFLNGDWGTLTVNAYGTVDILYPSGTLTLTIIQAGGSSSSDQGPPSVMQQFGKPASGTCDAAAPVTLNWGGAGSGGWGESWAQWMNSGNGGPVCTRTLVYSNNLGAWTVG